MFGRIRLRRCGRRRRIVHRAQTRKERLHRHVRGHRRVWRRIERRLPAERRIAYDRDRIQSGTFGIWLPCNVARELPWPKRCRDIQVSIEQQVYDRAVAASVVPAIRGKLCGRSLRKAVRHGRYDCGARIHQIDRVGDGDGIPGISGIRNIIDGDLPDARICQLRAIQSDARHDRSIARNHGSYARCARRAVGQCDGNREYLGRIDNLRRLVVSGRCKRNRRGI